MIGKRPQRNQKYSTSVVCNYIVLAIALKMESLSVVMEVVSWKQEVLRLNTMSASSGAGNLF